MGCSPPSEQWVGKQSCPSCKEVNELDWSDQLLLGLCVNSGFLSDVGTGPGVAVTNAVVDLMDGSRRGSQG